MTETMNADLVIQLARESMLQTVLMAGPALLAALLIGALVGLLQAVTQIQDPTISLVPKILGIFLTLAICLPWLIERMLDFSQRLFGSVPTFLGGG